MTLNTPTMLERPTVGFYPLDTPGKRFNRRVRKAEFNCKPLREMTYEVLDKAEEKGTQTIS